MATYRKTIAAALGTLTPAAVVAVANLAGADLPYGWAAIVTAVVAPLGVALARNDDTVR